MHQTKIADARRSPREDVNTLVKLRVGQSANVMDGELDNVSRNGFLVWAEEQVDIGERIVLVIEADQPGEQAIELAGVVVRIIHRENKRRLNGFGCELAG